ncbi:hypothetical protein Q7P37_003642 [Cladosporium fusiforme]
MMEITTTVLHSLPSFSLLRYRFCSLESHSIQKSDAFFEDAAESLKVGTSTADLLRSAQCLACEYHAHLQQPTPAMIPYPPTTLSIADKDKKALALDLGGSTLRISWVHFAPGQKPTLGNVRSTEIDSGIRNLHGAEFIQWITDRIEEAWWDLASTSTEFDHMNSRLSNGEVRCPDGEPQFDSMYNRIDGTQQAAQYQSTIPVAVTWSFPLIQTEVDRALIQDMGKGFNASSDLRGVDLQDVFATAFEQRSLPLRVTAIVNDAIANLTADMYSSPSTKFSIIAGTGINAAIPIARETISRRLHLDGDMYALGNETEHASEVFVNMELSMFGAKAFSSTKWDRLLDSHQETPGFQPLEQLCGGRYLGEILRLILVDAAERQHIFPCSLPEGLSQPFRLDTRLLACFEADSTPDLRISRKAFAAVFPDRSGNVISLKDARQILALARLISSRAAACLAASIVSMWLFKTKTEHTLRAPDGAKSVVKRVAFTGSVLEKYPGLRTKCQESMDVLMSEVSLGAVRLSLEFCPESSLVGAAAIAIQ